MKKLFSLFAVAVCLMTAASCDNDDDAAVRLPVYQDVVFTQGGTQVSARSIARGQMVAARLVQATKGSGIYQYTYTWTCDGDEAGLDKKVLRRIDTDDSVCEFVPKTPGNYTLTINVRYDYSGNKAPTIPSVAIQGGTVSYSAGGNLVGNATITKEIRII